MLGEGPVLHFPSARQPPWTDLRRAGLLPLGQLPALLDAARARGRKGGRPRRLDDKKKRHAALLHSDPTNSVKDICGTLRISKATLYRYLAEQRGR